MIVVTRSFSPQDIVGGHPALDLVNTVTSRDVAPPIDWLDAYPRLLEWAGLAGLADPAILQALSERAAASPGEAARALERIKRFREALYAAYAALIRAEPPPAGEIETIESVWKEAQSRRHLACHDHGVSARLGLSASGLDLIRDRMAGPAVELLCRLPTDRARLCRGERCGWLFIDSSKGGRRVWCDMATCGNAAKSRRLVQNRKAGHS
jgi:predicted RNA-binding Zn ribbon-like protein